jgi:hypothetical protein
MVARGWVLQVVMLACCCAPAARAADASVCLPLKANCNNTIRLYGDVPVVMPCAVASGPLPLLTGTFSEYPTLPLYFQGNFDLCRTFSSAHYCSIRTGQLAIPIGELGPGFPPRNVLPLGDFRMNQCVSKECSSALLRESIEGLLDLVAQYIVKIYPTFSPDQMKELILKELRVTCEDDTVEQLDVAGVATVVVLFTCAGLAMFATALHSYRSVDEFPKLIGWFSAKGNMTKLLKDTPGDFTAFNGIRVFSMIWIVTGHTLLNYTSPPPVNPNALQRLALR